MKRPEMTEENNSIEENVAMATYIQLARIYDILTIIASGITENPELVQNVVNMHAAGQILGPNPSMSAPEENVQQ
jgi:hypothetical protein